MQLHLRERNQNLSGLILVNRGVSCIAMALRGTFRGRKNCKSQIIYKRSCHAHYAEHPWTVSYRVTGNLYIQ